jgi:hypothetical protein
MPKDDQPLAGAAAAAAAARRSLERRRPTVARFRFEPDPRRLRTLLEEIDSCLDSRDPAERRQVRLLVSEIVSRLLDHYPEVPIHLDLEIKEDGVRVDIAQSDGGSDFWEAVDDAVFSDLTTGWGRDRRGSGGAWFEIISPPDAP